MEGYLNLFVKSIFIENMVFAYFLGMCSYLAVSKTVKTAHGLGMAVIFVLSVTVPINFLINKYILDDGALGTIQAMECEKAKNDIFHIGNDVEITIEELVKETGKYFNFTGSYEIATTYPGSVSRRCPDLTKSRKMLDFNPKTDWKDALVKTLDWYVNYYKENPSKRFFEGPNKFYK